jgi:hypothetical protein
MVAAGGAAPMVLQFPGGGVSGQFMVGMSAAVQPQPVQVLAVGSPGFPFHSSAAQHAARQPLEAAAMPPGALPQGPAMRQLGASVPVQLLPGSTAVSHFQPMHLLGSPSTLPPVHLLAGLPAGGSAVEPPVVPVLPYLAGPPRPPVWIAGESLLTGAQGNNKQPAVCRPF